MRIRILFLTIIFCIQISAQINEITDLQYKEILKNFDTSKFNTRYQALKIIKKGNRIFAFMSTTVEIYKCISYDEGKTWSKITSIKRDYGAFNPYIRNRFDVAINDDDSYLLFYTEWNSNVKSYVLPVIYKYSNEDELLFKNYFIDQASSKNPSTSSITASSLEICRISDNEYYVSYYNNSSTNSSGGVFIRHSIDGGRTWNLASAITSTESLSLAYSPLDGKLKAAFTIKQNDKSEILFSDDALIEDLMSTSRVLQTTTHDLPTPKLVFTKDRKAWIIYNTQSKFSEEYTHSDVTFITSTNNGKNWSANSNATICLGNDEIISASSDDEYPVVGLISNRLNGADEAYFYLSLGYSTDPAPPYIQKYYEAKKVEGTDSYIVRVKVLDNEPLFSVTANNKIYSLPLYDDGQHNDSLANDNIFGNELKEPSNYFGDATRVVDVNNVKLPFNNKGELAGVYPYLSIKYVITDQSQNVIEKRVTSRIGGSLGTYLGKGIMFAGGFSLSGYGNNELFANGQGQWEWAYQAGNVQSGNNNSNRIYSIKKTDPAFGYSWNEWKNAVDQGAYYYDGDGNGMYNPVDNNNNGIWEEDEDRPDLLYDATYFTVYNDGVLKEKRQWDTQDPVGIEIRQTIFASGTISELQDVVFIRYSIVYKGLDKPFESDTLKDVIFSIWTDMDIGNPSDDLVGCDTLINSAYGYNNGSDTLFNPDRSWGENPPAIFRTILQGPIIKTNNRQDVAHNRMGQSVGQKSFIGYKNVGIGAYVHHQSGFNYTEGPRSVESARYSMIGMHLLGSYPDPCDWWFGRVENGVNCDLVNPRFWFSGDPVSGSGWVFNDSYEDDLMDELSTREFELVKNEPMDIIVAYTVGQGTDALSSITDGREKVRKVIEIYEQNFPGSYTPLNYEEIYPKDFTLSQNYPNPFNPTSKIKYQIAKLGKVELKVYDILGREITTLVNDIKAPGMYEVTFNASQLASGVYFYRLISGSFMQTKKMILLR